jgi:hypothetical protein
MANIMAVMRKYQESEPKVSGYDMKGDPSLVKKILAALLLACLVSTPALLVGTGGPVAASMETPAPVPTPTWINLYGMESLLDGKLLPPGTIIEAFDPQGILCGQVVVDRLGQYGLMPVYGDDPSTPQDEGALPGDIIELRVNSVPAITSPTGIVWSSLGDLLRVEIDASSGGPYPVLQ